MDFFGEYSYRSIFTLIIMIMIQTYQELYYALQILKMLAELEDPLYKSLKVLIDSQIKKLL